MLDEKDDKKFIDRYIIGLELEGKNDEDKKKSLKELLKISLECRENEIKRYWSRSAYFWVFISTLFIVYFSILSLNFNELDVLTATLNKDKLINYKIIILSVISLIGTIFSFCCCLANQSSKYWQENWELHSEFLIRKCYGNLFGILLEKDYNKKIKKERPLKLYSVSRFNLFINAVFCMLWCLIFLAPILFIFNSFCFYLIGILVILILAFIISTRLKSKAKSKSKVLLYKREYFE